MTGSGSCHVWSVPEQQPEFHPPPRNHLENKPRAHICIPHPVTSRLIESRERFGRSSSLVSENRTQSKQLQPKPEEFTALGTVRSRQNIASLLASPIVARSNIAFAGPVQVSRGITLRCSLFQDGLGVFDVLLAHPWPLPSRN
jgi:hypothetical protein